MEIKKCPCCGSEAIYGAHEGKHTIKCLYCGLQITDDRMDKVIGLWNQREGKADSTSEKDLRVCEVIPRFFDPELNKPLPSKNDITFSDDVFIIDEDGMHGLAYYSFEDCQWKFHTDTLVDYNEVGYETKWKWYYPTFTVKDAF